VDSGRPLRIPLQESSRLHDINVYLTLQLPEPMQRYCSRATRVVLGIFYSLVNIGPMLPIIHTIDLSLLVFRMIGMTRIIRKIILRPTTIFHIGLVLGMD